MFTKWFPWRFIVRHAARIHGFLDPIGLLAHFDRFAEPSEVRAPTELLRAGLLLQARGFINNQAIQHNLDWVWPYWVVQQFDPRSSSFIPRAFSVIHINITHRNWTALGIPGCENMPIIDPRGLVTPHHDGWSMDFWIVGLDGTALFPSRLASVDQELASTPNLVVTTQSSDAEKYLTVACRVELINGQPSCCVDICALAKNDALLVVSARPFNPEGVSFIDTIATDKNPREVIINKKDRILFSETPTQILFSNYREGDVFRQLLNVNNPQRDHIACPVGMATCAAVYPITAAVQRRIELTMPLTPSSVPSNPIITTVTSGSEMWSRRMQGACTLQISDTVICRLFSAALTTMVLHTPGDVFAGPYTYKRFWFRDAVLILHPMLVLGLGANVKELVQTFFKRQRGDGYFMSQEGEWDSNGQVLWLINRFRLLTRTPLDPSWLPHISKAANWIRKKRRTSGFPGLLPAGFSAEHLGPNDNYYWDDFWSIAGLTSAAAMLEGFGNKALADICLCEAQDLLKTVLDVLGKSTGDNAEPIMSTSPHRRMDSAAVASLVATYPLQILPADGPLVRNTVHYLVDHCFVDNALFHDISHSGINPYLSLHIAQAMLRAGDPRYLQMVYRIRDLASPTGQWPEGIHPRTGYGCMGDGQHVWAAAEWAMMIRNCFVREEDALGKIVLCSGVAREWLSPDVPATFGPTHTLFGIISLTITITESTVRVDWEGVWHAGRPLIEISLPGAPSVTATPDRDWVEIIL